MFSRLRCALVIVTMSPVSFSPAQSPPPPQSMPLKDIHTWMCQLQKMESREAVERLSKQDYDLIVVEPTGTYRAAKQFDMKAMVGKLRAGKPRRIVLAYLDIAEADAHRAYWQKGWKLPGEMHRGEPDYLLKADPDGWKDTYIVRFSDPRWQELVLADVRQIIAAGFDGLFLDWLQAIEDATVIAEFRALGKDPQRAMVDFIATLRKEALTINRSARIVTQNAPYLLDADERLVGLVDAVAFENTWFGGKAEVDWDDPEGGDRPNKSADDRHATPALIKQYARWASAGKPVLTLDYCIKPENAKKVYEGSQGAGFIPLVSRSALDRITETAPPGLK